MRVYVTEEEEQLLKSDVQTIFFGTTDRLRAKKGTADRPDVMAVVSQGLGQALRAACEKDKTDPKEEAPRWVDAFYEHLGEVGVKVDRKKVKKVTGVCPEAAAIMADLRKHEEVLFTRNRELRLKLFLTACYRVVPSMKGHVKPLDAAGIFEDHFWSALEAAPPKGRLNPFAKKKPKKKK